MFCARCVCGWPHTLAHAPTCPPPHQQALADIRDTEGRCVTEYGGDAAKAVLISAPHIGTKDHPKRIRGNAEELACHLSSVRRGCGVQEAAPPQAASAGITYAQPPEAAANHRYVRNHWIDKLGSDDCEVFPVYKCGTLAPGSADDAEAKGAGPGAETWVGMMKWAWASDYSPFQRTSERLS